jgi:hypothetical protein
MNVIDFMDKLYEYDESYAEERLIYTLIELSIKGYEPFEVLQMTMDEALFLLEIPYNKPQRRGNTTWGSHLATINP